jgi:hypothetical protein
MPFNPPDKYFFHESRKNHETISTGPNQNKGQRLQGLLTLIHALTLVEVVTYLIS